MKRIFFVLTAAMVIFSSCSKSEVSSPIQPSPQKQNEQKTVEEKGEENKNDNKQAPKTSAELPKATTLNFRSYIGLAFATAAGLFVRTYERQGS